MLDLQTLLVPNNAADFWTAVSAVATAIAVWFAYLAARYAAHALTLEHTPVVNLLRRGDDAELRAVGPGVALNVLLTTDEGVYLTSVAILRPDAAFAIRANDLGDNDSFYIYAQDMTGRWHYTRAAYQGLRWNDGSDVANMFRGRIGAWRIPRRARAKLERTTETSWEYYRAISSPFTRRGMALRIKNLWIWIRIDVWRWLWSFPDARRVARFSERLNAPMPGPVAPEVRQTWPVDLDGDIACWKGNRTARQVSCQWEGNYLMCDIDLRSGMPGGVRGLVCIERLAFEALPDDRTRLSHAVRRRFSRYICRLRPREPFVFELRKFGPFLIDWPG